MPTPAQERRAQQLRSDRDRCAAAAAVLRHRVNQGRYAGLRNPDEGYYIAAIIETGGMLLDQLPLPHARAILAAATRLLDDDPGALGPVQPLTNGPGH